MPDLPPADEPTRKHQYWQANIRYVLILLAIWFIVSYGIGIILAPWLNQFRLPGSGFKLGFWFAQQGSIYTFVLLIFIYVWLMNRLDRRFGVSED
jgi:putative solute:sodium symporter small subunit